MRPATETFTVVVLSTGHVTKGTADSLDEIIKLRFAGTQSQVGIGDWRYWVIAERWAEYGWWVWAGIEDGRDELPADLRACLDYGRDHGARWVMFDCDGPLEPELTRYEW